MKFYSHDIALQLPRNNIGAVSYTHLDVYKRQTLACGTGACASVVAGVINDYCDTRVTVQLKGGDLEIEWDKIHNQVYLTGDAHFVFKGEIPD